MKISSTVNSFYFSIFLLLLFILPIPHTIGIRNAFFYILVLVTIFLLYKSKEIISLKDIFKSSILKIFIFLTFWIILSIFLFSQDLSWSIDEFRGQWLPLILYLFLGTSISLLISKNILKIDKKIFVTLIFYFLFLHILYLDFYVVYQYLTSGIFEQRIGGLTNAADMVNYVTNLLFALIIAETVYRIKNKTKFMIFSNLILFFIYALLFLSFAIEGLRNGIIPMILMFTSAIYLLMLSFKLNKLKKVSLSFFLILLLSIPFAYSISKDKRWNSLFETVSVVSDNQDNIYWLKRTGDVPKLTNGNDVNLSNYLRLAWALESINLIKENPFGIGYSRNAFGYGVYLKYNLGRGMHSHSGVLDFTIATGLIGIFIWFLFILAVLINSYRHIKDYNSFYSLVVFFITIDFVSRSFLDSNMRDHIFLEFIILLGVFSSFMLLEENNEKN